MSSLNNNNTISSSSTSNEKGPAPIENKSYLDEPDPSDILKKIKISNLNRLVIGQININSLRNKFESLKSKLRVT